MVEPGRVHPDAIKIVVVFEHIHRVIGDVNGAVVVAVALLHAGRGHANHFEGHAIDADGLADRRHAGEKFVARLGTDDGIEAMLHIVGVVEKASLGHVEIPDLLNRRVEAHDRESKRPVLVLNGRLFIGFTHDMAAQRNVIAQQFDIVVGEANLNARLIAAGLLRKFAPEILLPKWRRSSQIWLRWHGRSRCRRKVAAQQWRCPRPSRPW